LTVLTMASAAGLATLRLRTAMLAMALSAVVLGVGWLMPGLPGGSAVPVAIVQGSTPCPFIHCDNERYGTYLQHLELTRTIPEGAVDLVVWSEGSTGSFDADPINAPSVGDAIGAEAARIGAWMVVGGDRPVSETHWVSANALFSPEGESGGEDRTRHALAFGEHLAARPLFEWIPALDQVPRDMIPGDGPVAFDLGEFQLGTVISFEGGFAGYTRAVVHEGADLLVVATNQGSYGYSPAADQF